MLFRSRRARSRGRRRVLRRRARTARARPDGRAEHRHRLRAGTGARGHAVLDRLPEGGRGLLARDRKSVVSGKSVYVRIDLGGRRFNKKKHITNIYVTTNDKYIEI